MTNEDEIWRGVKGKLIHMFGSLTVAAAKFECHPNSLRAAALGKCPGIKKDMDKAIAKFNKKQAEQLVAA